MKKNFAKRSAFAVLVIILGMLLSVSLFGCDKPRRYYDEIYVKTWKNNEEKFVLGTFETKGSIFRDPLRFDFNVPNEKVFFDAITKDPRFVKELSSIHGDQYLFNEYVFFENGYYRLNDSSYYSYALHTDTASAWRLKQIYRFPINRNVEFESNGGENNIIKTDKSWDYYLNYYSRFADDCVSVDKAKK